MRTLFYLLYGMLLTYGFMGAIYYISGITNFYILLSAGLLCYTGLIIIYNYLKHT